MAFELAQSVDASTYLNEAQTLAQDAQLDFLEVVGLTVTSSARPSGRRVSATRAAATAAQAAFLKREDLPDGTSALGIFAVRAIPRSESPAGSPYA